MNEPFGQLQRYAKQGLAAVLFIMLLVGASAAAFFVLAAGISALSGSRDGATAAAVSSIPAAAPASTSPVTTATAAEQSTQTPQQPSLPSSSSGQPVRTMSSDNASQSAQTGSGEATDGLYSPVGEALDQGGVLLGNQIQNAFGQVLSGVLKALFLEQSDHAPQTGQNHG